MPSRRVLLAVSDDVPIFEVAIPCEVFGRPRLDIMNPWYELRVCARVPGRTRTGAGFVAGTTYGLGEVAKARKTDTLIVPACADVLESSPPDLVDAVRKAHARGARIVSLCTGAFVLAEAGLLDGRRATVHWLYADILAKRYPKVSVDPSVLYVDDGDVLTSAGVAAGLDLCLHLVRLDFGARIANVLARRLVISPHRPGGQAQYLQTPLPKTDDEGLAPLLHWTLRHLDRPLTIADLAKRQHLTPRTLIRHFRAATGMPPLKWLLAQRVQKACSLLESTRETPARIAELCGLGGEANLRHHFARIMGVPPTEYRRTFERASA
ncbi:helix-turn-helix domain-containing protein [Pendulispora rubella]|uniref:Helix-turn-helix domain-containing protein n=1 Tax=Pendulispora rubella TaxID=2741070 RepID=A0ABZ2KT14_9BACT